MESNKLTTLPASIGQLSNLETLNLCQNKLKTLPESVVQALKILKKQGCSISGYDELIINQWDKREKEERERINALKKTAIQEKDAGKLGSAIQSLKEAKKIAKKLGDEKALNDILCLLSSCKYEKEKLVFELIKNMSMEKISTFRRTNLNESTKNSLLDKHVVNKRIENILKEMLASAPEIIFSFFIELNGRSLISVMPTDVNEECIIDFSYFLSISADFIAECEKGGLEQFFVRCERGYIFFNKIQGMGYLVSSTTKIARGLGLGLGDFKYTCDKIEEVLEPMNSKITAEERLLNRS